MVQSHAAELEARLAREAGEHRRRAERSRHARTVAADRLSAAESRAAAAEARVEAVVRHLTLSERRLREAERRVAIEAAEGIRREVEGRQAMEAAAPEVVKYELGQPTATGDLVGDHTCTGKEATEASAVRRTMTYSDCSSSEEERYLSKSPLPPPSPGGHGEKALARPIAGDEHHSQDRVLRGINNTNTRHGCANFPDASQREGGSATLPEQQLNTPGRPGDIRRMTVTDNEHTTSRPRDVDRYRQVDGSEQENVLLSEGANILQVETEKTAASDGTYKDSAVVESERLVQGLRSTGEEVIRASFSTAV